MLKRNFGPCVVVRPRQDGTARLRFEVRRNRPARWSPSQPILIGGRDNVRLEELSPGQIKAIEREAEEMYRDLERMRVQESAGDEAIISGQRSWLDLIELRRAHSNWQQLAPASQRTYASVQRQIVNLLGGDPALAPSTVVESQIDKIFLRAFDSPYRRKAAYLETRRLLEKAVREAWRDPALTILYSSRLPKPKMRIWSAGDLQCAVTAAITENERGLAKMLLTQWEIGQRLQSVRNFRYGHQYRDGTFFYRCVKTDREIRIRILNPTARRIIDVGYQHGAYMFPRAEDGHPFTGIELSRDFTRIRRTIPGFDQRLQLRQLRHTVVLELALAGCSIPEISSITSHDMATVHRTLQHYLSANAELAERAMEKREQRRIEHVVGSKTEVIIDGTRAIFLGDVPEAVRPQAPTETASRASV